MTVTRRTVDLTAYPDLVVIYLGMRVNRLRGLRRLGALGPQIARSAADQPDGLLQHDNLIYSLVPLHLGMRQYWRDYDALEAWTRSEPHRDWWRQFLHETGGTGFWHEAYMMRGGMEAIYDDLPDRSGFAAFAPVVPATGPAFSARARSRHPGDPATPVIAETDLT
jgi:Monooxygenase af470-like